MRYDQTTVDAIAEREREFIHAMLNGYDQTGELGHYDGGEFYPWADSYESTEELGKDWAAVVNYGPLTEVTANGFESARLKVHTNEGVYVYGDHDGSLGRFLDLATARGEY